MSSWLITFDYKLKLIVLHFKIKKTNDNFCDVNHLQRIWLSLFAKCLCNQMLCPRDDFVYREILKVRVQKCGEKKESHGQIDDSVVLQQTQNVDDSNQRQCLTIH